MSIFDRPLRDCLTKVAGLPSWLKTKGKFDPAKIGKMPLDPVMQARVDAHLAGKNRAKHISNLSGELVALKHQVNARDRLDEKIKNAPSGTPESDSAKGSLDGNRKTIQNVIKRLADSVKASQLGSNLAYKAGQNAKVRRVAAESDARKDLAKVLRGVKRVNQINALLAIPPVAALGYYAYKKLRRPRYKDTVEQFETSRSGAGDNK
jgi:hypothetical protein